jgi:protocatechuate 3,4-dioxygenase beta subunit
MRSRISSVALSAAAGAVALVAFTALPESPAGARTVTFAQEQGQGGGRGGGGAARGTQAPARDRAPAVGTGRISGTVMLGGAGTPVRRARVNLTGGDLRGSRSAITDEQGGFVFEALPPGRFNLAVSKPGYVTMTYGAKRPGRPGTPIQLAEGQRMEKVTIEIPRGGVLTGVVVDEHGEPSPGTTVRALRFQMQTGEKTLQQAGQDQTDDRGVYRIFQLQPGEYMVSAAPRNMNLSDIRQVLSAQINALAAEASAEGVGLRGGGGFRIGGAGTEFGGRGGRGGAILEQLQEQLAQVEGEQAQTYAPVYFPGTPSPSSAVTVTLGVSEERSGVDFQLQLVPTARVSGTVTSTMGPLPQGTQVALIPADRAGLPSIPGQPSSTARVNQEGRFTFQNVTPGQYTLHARGTVREAVPETPVAQGRAGRAGGGGGGRGGRGAIAQVLWAAADVTVSGEEVSGIVLNLQSGMTVSGRIEFQGAALPPLMDLQRVRVTLVTRGQQLFEGGPTPPAEVDASGNFTITGVVPGRYVLSGSIPAGARGNQPAARGVPTPGGGSWVLRSVMIAGRDALDFPIEIGPNQNITGASVLFTDQTQSLSGTIQDATGRPTADFTIILYPSNNQYWVPQSRRIASARPGTDGRFNFGSIPPGEYRITAVTDVEPGEWYDPAFLSQLLPVSIPVAVAEGEKKVQDIRLAGGM